MPRATKRHFTSLGLLSQPPVLEYNPLDGEWLVWLSYDRDKQAGTYLRLGKRGAIVQQSENTKGEVTEQFTVKPAED